jgi:hypothetical protein
MLQFDVMIQVNSLTMHAYTDSVVDPDSYPDSMRSLDPYPDPDSQSGGQKWPRKIRKQLINFLF